MRIEEKVRIQRNLAGAPLRENENGADAELERQRHPIPDRSQTQRQVLLPCSKALLGNRVR